MMTASDAMDVSPAGASALPGHDTVRMPWTSAAEFEEYIVRPALAILYRLAVGPGADYYCPRFLRYERTGRSLPGWHWPAFFMPAIWAFYRKLWLPGILFALLPVAGVSGLGAVAPLLGESELAWLGAAVCALWVFPGIIAAALANSLLYRRMHRLVRLAEARSDKKHEVAAQLAGRRGVSPVAALVLGGGTLALTFTLVASDLDTLYWESRARAGIAESIAAVQPLQREIEASLLAEGVLPPHVDYSPVRSYLNATFLDTVTLSPSSGRLRLLLGPAISELSGKVILLAPTVDDAQHIRWLCVPVDVPVKFLPLECQKR